MADALAEEEEALRIFVEEWREALRKSEERDIEEFLRSAHAKESHHGPDWPPLLEPPQAHELVNTATTCTPESTSPTGERPDTLDEAPLREESQPQQPPVRPAQAEELEELEQPQELQEPEVQKTPQPQPASEELQPRSREVTEEQPEVVDVQQQPVQDLAASPRQEASASPVPPMAPHIPVPDPSQAAVSTEASPPSDASLEMPENAAAAEAPEVPEVPAEPKEPKQTPPDLDPPAQEKHQVDQEAVKAAAIRAAEMLSELTKPLEYDVREAVSVHESPDPQSASLGSLAPGQVVHGYPGSGWLRLQPSGSVRGWVHIGRSLAVQCLLPTIRARYLEGVEVAWPGFKRLLKPDVKVVYIVEWRCKKTGAAGHAVCHKPQEVVSNMPPGKPFELHVAVRIRGPAKPGVDAAPEARFAGLWIESQTLQLQQGDDEEDAESCLDPFGTARAGCLNCQCYGFLWRPGLEEQQEDEDGAQRLGLNADPESIKCMRCGDPFDSHARAGTPAAARLLESRPLRKYLVAHARVFVRSRRSTSGDALGALRRGTEVSGCLEGNWLHLSQASARECNAMPRGSANAKAKYVDAWVLIDGACVGFQSDLLVPEELAPPELREQIQQEEEERRRKAAEASAKRAPQKQAVRKKDARDPKASKEPVEVNSEDEVAGEHSGRE